MPYAVHVLLAAALAAAGPAVATPPVPRATVALVGQADRFTVGQGGYCAARTEIEKPSGVRFEVPAGQRTFFYIRGSVASQVERMWCEGDYSFVPEAGHVHIVRYTLEQKQCRLELFSAPPGGTPVPMDVVVEERRSCLGR